MYKFCSKKKVSYYSAVCRRLHPKSIIKRQDGSNAMRHWAYPAYPLNNRGCINRTPEIATAVENNIPVKVIVLNNRALGMVRQWQELFYKKRYSSTILKEVNFAEIAKSFGAKGIRVTEKEQLVSALSSAIDYPGPAVVDVIVEQEENVIPMVPPGAPIDRIVGGK